MLESVKASVSCVVTALLLGTVDCRPPLVPTTTHQPPLARDEARDGGNSGDTRAIEAACWGREDRGCGGWGRPAPA